MDADVRNLKVYEIFVQTITAAEQRRLQSNALFLSIVSATLVLTSVTDFTGYSIIAAINVVVSVLWIISVLYFRALADAKFKVIADIEKQWDFRPFELESLILSQNVFVKLAAGMTYIELLLPISTLTLAILYIGIRYLL